jgi:4-carboxymuconolactone decarboxylase
VTDDAFDAVVSRWGKQGAIDLIGVLGYYSLVSFVLNVDRYPPPEGAVPLSAI